MWSIFHSITFFERALKRSGTKKSNPNLQNYSTTSSPHPMASHLSWMLPPLLKVKYNSMITSYHVTFYFEILCLDKSSLRSQHMNK